MKTNLLLTVIVLSFLLACKQESTTVDASAKCASTTVLDSLLAGGQLYLSVTYKSGDGKPQTAILNLKDQIGKARIVLGGFLLEYPVNVVREKPTIVAAVGVRAVVLVADGSPVPLAIYSPDSYTFEDKNCVLTTTATDGAFLNTTFTYRNITKDPNLASILKPFGW